MSYGGVLIPFSVQPPPLLPCGDLADTHAGHAKFSMQIGLTLSICEPSFDLSHLILVELCEIVSISPKGAPTQHHISCVVRMRSGLQVIRTDTRGIVAFMTNEQPFRNWSIQAFPGPARSFYNPLAIPESPELPSPPGPAVWTFHDLIPEALLNRYSPHEAYVIRRSAYAARSAPGWPRSAPGSATPDHSYRTAGAPVRLGLRT